MAYTDLIKYIDHKKKQMHQVLNDSISDLFDITPEESAVFSATMELDNVIIEKGISEEKAYDFLLHRMGNFMDNTKDQFDDEITSDRAGIIEFRMLNVFFQAFKALNE